MDRSAATAPSAGLAAATASITGGAAPAPILPSASFSTAALATSDDAGKHGKKRPVTKYPPLPHLSHTSSVRLLT
jgi:hypothetical protein